MKTSTKLALLGSAVLGVAAWTLTAQDSSPPPDRDRPQRREDGPPGAGREGRFPMMPLIGALDANHDGVIDADELKNASAALLKLDKNGDGKLSREEFMGRPPSRQDGPPPGGPSDRPEGRPEGRDRRDARLDDSARPPHGPDAGPGDFRPPRDGRGPGPGGERGERADRGERMGPPSAQDILEKFDANSDGKLDKTELAAFLKDMRDHRPPALAGGPRPDGFRPDGPRPDGFRPDGPPPGDAPPR
jgi:hypothetical protein